MHAAVMTLKEESNHAGKSGANACVMTAVGAVGTVLAAICCATPVLGVVLGALGLSVWLAEAHYALIPIFLAGLGLLGTGLYRWRFT
jgi:hypothetical protein